MGGSTVTPAILNALKVQPAAAPAPAAAAPAAPVSPNQLYAQQLIGLINQPGTMSGGTPGYTTSNAGARAAAQAAYNQSSANEKQIYGEAVQNVLNRAPAIGTSYDNAAATLENQAAARGTAATAAADQRNANAALAAQRMGLNFTPTTNGLAAASDAAYGNQVKTNADAWKGLLAANKQTALSGNQRTADAFTYSGTQAQDALSSLLSSAMSKLVDVYHPGKAGKMSGGTSASVAAGIYKSLMGETDKSDAALLNKQKFAASLAPKTSTSTKSVGGKTISSTSNTKSVAPFKFF